MAIDQQLKALYEMQGNDRGKFRQPEAGATHLRVQSVCGRAVPKCGYIFAHDREELIAVADLAPHEIHELLGVHLHGRLRVEQVSYDGRAVAPVAPPVQPPPPLQAWTKDEVLDLAKKHGIAVGAKSKSKLIAEVRAAEAAAIREEESAKRAKSKTPKGTAP